MKMVEELSCPVARLITLVLKLAYVNLRSLVSKLPPGRLGFGADRVIPARQKAVAEIHVVRGRLVQSSLEIAELLLQLLAERLGAWSLGARNLL